MSLLISTSSSFRTCPDIVLSLQGTCIEWFIYLKLYYSYSSLIKHGDKFAMHHGVIAYNCICRKVQVFMVRYCQLCQMNYRICLEKPTRCKLYVKN